MLSWLGMMIVHEFHYCLNAWGSGGSVSKVVLHPPVTSCTDLVRNPRQLFVTSRGSLIGFLLPFVALAVVRLLRLFQFFAGFYLIVNGIYVAGDSFCEVTDGENMMPGYQDKML
jgi:hypothetical protein